MSRNDDNEAGICQAKTGQTKEMTYESDANPSLANNSIIKPPALTGKSSVQQRLLEVCRVVFMVYLLIPLLFIVYKIGNAVFGALPEAISIAFIRTARIVDPSDANNSMSFYIMCLVNVIWWFVAVNLFSQVSGRAQSAHDNETPSSSFACFIYELIENILLSVIKSVPYILGVYVASWVIFGLLLPAIKQIFID